MFRRHDFDNLKMENILINAKLLKQFEDKNYNLILWDTILCKSVVFPHKAPPRYPDGVPSIKKMKIQVL